MLAVRVLSLILKMDVICCSEMWFTFTGLYCPISQKVNLFNLQIVSWIYEFVFWNTSLLIERKKVLLNSLQYVLKRGLSSPLPSSWVIKVKKTIYRHCFLHDCKSKYYYLTHFSGTGAFLDHKQEWFYLLERCNRV